MSAARTIAARCLERVLFAGEYAAAALDDELNSNADSSSKDRGLATELVYGVLRTKTVLVQRLNALAPRGIERDQFVLVRLLIAAYELLLLDRVPDFASVNEAVSAVQAKRGQRVGGFCNAVLRKLAQSPKLDFAEAITGSAPAWLRAELIRALGNHEADSLLGVPSTESARGSEGPPSEERTRRSIGTACVRFTTGTPVPEWASNAERGRLYTDAHRFIGKGDLRRHPEYATGGFVIQDEGSMFAALLLGTVPGEKILDACAGRGHKASLLSERVGPTGSLWVTDVSRRKLEQLEGEFGRLRLPPPVSNVVDWSMPNDALPRDFDRVLVDAPCTGSGTLRRRPEIALRLTPNDVERLASLAESILRNAAAHVRPGGVVQFVVCSVFERETREVVNRVSDLLTPDAFELLHPLVAEGATSLYLSPAQHNTDGFFIARFRRREMTVN